MEIIEVNNITSNYCSVSTSNPALYNVVLADDLNQCPANVDWRKY